MYNHESELQFLDIRGIADRLAFHDGLFFHLDYRPGNGMRTRACRHGFGFIRYDRLRVRWIGVSFSRAGQYDGYDGDCLYGMRSLLFGLYTLGEKNLILIHFT